MKKRAATYIRPIILLLLVVSMGALAYILVTGPLFLVDTVYVFGDADALPDTSILQRSYNIFFYPKTKIKSVLQKLPLVKSVEITRQLPRTVIVRITERTPSVSYINTKQEVLIDSSGQILPRLPRFGNYSQLNCFLGELEVGEKVSDPLVSFGLKLVEAINSTGLAAESLTCNNEGSLALTITGVEVLVSPDKNVPQTAASLQFLFRQFRIEGKLPQKVDLRFTKPILIPKMEAGEASNSRESQ